VQPDYNLLSLSPTDLFDERAENNASMEADGCSPNNINNVSPWQSAWENNDLENIRKGIVPEITGTDKFFDLEETRNEDLWEERIRANASSSPSPLIQGLGFIRAEEE